MCFQRCFVALAFLVATVASGRADIFRWDNGQLIPGTAGITPGPGVQLDHHELAYALLDNQDLTGSRFDFSNLSRANLRYSTLTNANLTGANLAGAIMYNSTLRNANLSGAVVTGANLQAATAFTKEQLYSTASYQQKNLSGIALNSGLDLSGWDFNGQNLANAILSGSTLTNANLSGANLANAILQDSTLTNANLSGANLENAYLFRATLTNANLSGADTRGAQDLDLTGATSGSAILPTGGIAGLSLAAGDQLLVRNYLGDPTQSLGPIPIDVQNHMAMTSGGVLQMLFDADTWHSTMSFQPGIPVTLGGTLELVFAPGVDVAAQNGRTIDLFNWTGVTPTGTFTVSSPYIWNLSKLYSTGEVTLSIPLPGDYNGNGTVGPEDYNLWKTSFGSTTDLAADGNGNGIVDAADYTVWRDHAATLPLTGDYNHNGIVDAADYTLWRDSMGSTTNLAADGNGNGTIDAGDYTAWKTNFGHMAGSGAALPSANPLSAAVPEPATLVLLLVGMAAVLTQRWRVALCYNPCECRQSKPTRRSAGN